MIDLGAHGMYLINWILGLPISASSTFTVCCDSAAMAVKNTDHVEDNAVTVMKFENGAIAVNETGFVTNYSPQIFEVCGEDGYVRMKDDNVVKCTKATNGERLDVTVGKPYPAPIDQFLTGNVCEGCSVEEGKALTCMMVMAYDNA